MIALAFLIIAATFILGIMINQSDNLANQRHLELIARLSIMQQTIETMLDEYHSDKLLPSLELLSSQREPATIFEKEFALTPLIKAKERKELSAKDIEKLTGMQ